MIEPGEIYYGADGSRRKVQSVEGSAVFYQRGLAHETLETTVDEFETWNKPPEDATPEPIDD